MRSNNTKLISALFAAVVLLASGCSGGAGVYGQTAINNHARSGDLSPDPPLDPFKPNYGIGWSPYSYDNEGWPEWMNTWMYD